MSVLDDIVRLRRARIRRQGHAMGAAVPASRAVPVVPFGAEPFLICEVKRRSPSRGMIAPDRDAVAQARAYAERGVHSVSVLTEQDHFGGSLEDLIRIKHSLPGVSVLRKDFLLDEEDIEISWRAGADAVLLIASLLDEATLSRLHRRSRTLGLEPLVEVHGPADARKCRTLAPELTGINSRDLSTFSVDLAHPFVVKESVAWTTRLVFESGIRSADDVLIALSGGFAGVLAGEAVMRSPELVSDLLAAFTRRRNDFWSRLFTRRKPARPLVKVCGITRVADAEAAVSLGADALGFVFAPSKRQADATVLRALRHLAVPKIAVVVTARTEGRARLDPTVEGLLADGLIDAVQFHGDESPEECWAMAFPSYKALRVRGLREVEAITTYRSPRVLVDAYSPSAPGGTGTSIPRELVREAKRRLPLWLAGGMGADNVAEILHELQPELVDASSRLEASPGAKDPAKLAAFFREINEHAAVS